MTNLREILNQYQDGQRGLPDFRECSNIAFQIDQLTAELKATKAYAHFLACGEHDEQRDVVRANFERDCV